MTPNNIRKSIATLYELRRPAMIWGAPGVGKTGTVEAAVNDLSEKYGEPFGLVDFRLAMRDPTALMGFPMPDAKTKTMKFYRDEELPTSGRGIIFLDEINSAAQATQAAAMQLTLTGKVGSYTKPDGWAIMAAGNRESDRGVVHRMPSPLSLRMVHIDYEISLDDWTDWAVDAGVSHEVISFIRFRPGLLHAFDPAERSSPNPRSWEFVNQIYTQHMDKDIEFELISGTVGKGAGGEFAAYVDIIADLPTREQILLAPDKVETFNESPAKQFAVSSMLALSAEKHTMDNMMVYMNRLPVEYQVVFCRDAVRKDQTVCQTPSFRKWALANNKVMV